MAPRRTASVASATVQSRPGSPAQEEDEVPFFDTVDELQQHARTDRIYLSPIRTNGIRGSMFKIFSSLRCIFNAPQRASP